MNKKVASAPKDVLVQIVKQSQQKGMEGDKGGWKDFLKVYDPEIGVTISDPARRTPEALRAFLQTFNQEEHLKYLDKLFKCYSNRELVKQQAKIGDAESYEQKLVRLTLEHPRYPAEYSFPSYEQGWVVTKLRKKFKGTTSNKMLAADCEMVLCEDGTEAVVKICVVDQDLEVILHEFVNPNKAVADYRTHITGVSAEDLDGITCSLADIQEKLKKLLARGSILVGHSLSNDLKVLKVDHARVIDTAYVFKYGDESVKRKPSLNDLCKTVLGFELRKNGAPHNCVDDACAAMKLVLAQTKHGYDDAITAVQDKVPDAVCENAKLLIHRIPKDLPNEELGHIIPGDYTIKIQDSKKGQSDKYSAVATFNSPQEALSAYENLQGFEEKESSGRSQKPVFFKLKSGTSAKIYVRKMLADNPPIEVSAKRPCPTELAADDSKKLKTEQPSEDSQQNPCVDHVKEIERLKDLVNRRDEEITRLNKIVTSLTRKQGLIN